MSEGALFLALSPPWLIAGVIAFFAGKLITEVLYSHSARRVASGLCGASLYVLLFCVTAFSGNAIVRGIILSGTTDATAAGMIIIYFSMVYILPILLFSFFGGLALLIFKTARLRPVPPPKRYGVLLAILFALLTILSLPSLLLMII